MVHESGLEKARAPLFVATPFDRQSLPTAIIFGRGCFSMGEETNITRTPPLPKEPPRTEPPVRTMPMEKARKLIRKTSAEHAELFRRLAK
jgi:hypothetical protein